MDDDRDDMNPQPFIPRRNNNNNNYSINSRIMLTAIISLSIVVIFVTLLHLYARFVLRRRSRRRATIRQLQHFSTANTHSTDQTPPTGLDPSILTSLPLSTFTSHPETTSECAVCLSILENGDIVRILPNCKHQFHSECIDKWFGSHSTCPICRTGAEPRLVIEPSQPDPGVQPTAPPLTVIEGTSDSQPSAKVRSGSSSRLSSFRRMLSLTRESRRTQSCEQEDALEDLERQ